MKYQNRNRERKRAKGEHKSHVHSIILAHLFCLFIISALNQSVCVWCAPFPLFMHIVEFRLSAFWLHVTSPKQSTRIRTFFWSTLLSIVHLMIAFLHQGKFCYIMLALWFSFRFRCCLKRLWWYVKTFSYFVPGTASCLHMPLLVFVSFSFEAEGVFRMWK